MNTLTRLVWIGLLLALCRCNRFTDRQPTPDHAPPAVSVQFLTGQYPQAQDIVFSTVAPNQLWQATFAQQHQRYRALTSPARLLMADRLVDGTVADSLIRFLPSTVVAGGTFSGFRQRNYEWNRSLVNAGQNQELYAEYTWQQQPHTAHWSITRMANGERVYNFYLLPAQKFEYQTETLTDLPESLRAILRDQGMTFRVATIQVDALHKRRYMLSLLQPSAPPSEQYWQFYYDDAGKLLAFRNEATAQIIQRIDQLPPAVQQYLQRPELAGFGLTQGGGFFGYTGRHTYGARSTYWVSLAKDKQAWLLAFSDGGELVSRSFLTVGTL